MACYTTNSFEGKIIKLKLKWEPVVLLFDLLVNWGGNESKYYNIYI